MRNGIDTVNQPLNHGNSIIKHIKMHPSGSIRKPCPSSLHGALYVVTDTKENKLKNCIHLKS